MFILHINRACAHVQEEGPLMLAKGGVSQSEAAAVLHVSKCEVSACERAIRERGLTFDDVAAMSAAEVDGMLAPPREPRESAHLSSDMAPPIERKKRNRKLTVKMFWMEHCEAAAAAGRAAYSYQTFCELFSEADEKAGAKRRLAHEPGAMAYVDWAGDIAAITDRLTGTRAKAYLIVVALPYSARFLAQGFAGMRQRSGQDGQAHAFENFGGVPRMLVPDNAATVTNRSSVYVTLINDEYLRFAERCGAAVVPVRVRRPCGKALADSTVDLVEKMGDRPIRRDDILHAGGVQRVLPGEGTLAECPAVLGKGRVARLDLRGRGMRVRVDAAF